MINKIKTVIQDKLYQKSFAEYEEALERQSNPYLMWMQETEIAREKEGAQESHPSVSVLNQEDCTEKNPITAIKEEITIVISDKGRLAKDAVMQIAQFFEQHPDTDVVYADEDVWFIENQQEEIAVGVKPEVVEEVSNDDQGFAHRMCPWMKPIWSPETFFSFFYFGNIFAVKTSHLQKISWLGSTNYQKNIYDCMLQVTEKTQHIDHIEQVLFHLCCAGKEKKQLQEKMMLTRNLMGADATFDDIKRAALNRRGIVADFVTDSETGFSYPCYGVSDKDQVSIIIPSKDNPEVLRTCIHSIRELTTYPNYEIIVVDNGSSSQNREVLEKLAKEYEIQYLYMPMDFNFSKMCNLGAEKASGNYLLLLNDDMEVIQPDWLERMLGAASQAGVGAVGAKLLYPNSTLIQHAGITNTVDGPGHKLKQMDDQEIYYYGRNKLIYNMIGVTAACLMLKRSIYKEVNGLFEGLKVAYNDVDFCFRLYEHGLRNVQRNDVVLYHHESLSRGDDMQDAKKMLRLKTEKETLYQRHPDLYMVDPYCGRNMNAGEPAYECRYVYGFEYADETKYQDYIVPGKPFPPESKMNHAIMVVVEDLGKETLRKAGTEKKPYYLLKGWAYVPGADNSRYHMNLALRNQETGKIWNIPVRKRYRKDVEAILPKEVHVALTGFVCWIYEGSIPAGTYELWMVAKDQCSRQWLYRNTEKVLQIEN